MKRNLTQSYAILNFYKNLRAEFDLPVGVEIMNPFINPITWQLVKEFYNKFYNDKATRIFIFGINPGRFGGGVTGIPFTDPIRLENECGIKNDLNKKPELSSVFIYNLIHRMGGGDSFYKKFFFSALSPLGFIKNGTNMNYYDDRQLLKTAEPFMVDCIREQLNKMVCSRDICFCLGEGTNFKIFEKLNQKHDFFQKIIPLPHPRWIMQYRRRRLEEFVNLYVEKLLAVSF